MTIERNRDEILRIAARHGARNVRVCGSVARGEVKMSRWVSRSIRRRVREIVE
jgi:predicted nucleotidyltransferase